MICNENIHRVTKYFLFIVLILFHLSFAQDEIELSLEDEEEISWKPPRRHLLYSSSSDLNGPSLAVYIIAVIIITFISACCRYCIKQGCEPSEAEYQDAIVHAPPRRQNLTVPVTRPSGGRVLNPPRSSSSIILPPEPGVFTVDFTGIENPNYSPSNHAPAPSFPPPAPSYHSPTVPQFSAFEAINEDPTPLLDLPPSYESVIREQNSSNSQFTKVFDKPPKQITVFTVNFTGIENPTYNPSNSAPSYQTTTIPQFLTYEPSKENSVLLLDLPPSYESVIRKQKSSNSEFAKAFDNPSNSITVLKIMNICEN